MNTWAWLGPVLGLFSGILLAVLNKVLGKDAADLDKATKLWKRVDDLEAMLKTEKQERQAEQEVMARKQFVANRHIERLMVQMEHAGLPPVPMPDELRT